MRYLAAVSAIVVAGAAHAQSSVTLFGIVDTGLVYQSNARVTGSTTQGASLYSMQSGNLSTSRFGLRGSEDLGGGLSAVFWLENGFATNTGAAKNGGDLFGRQSWVGLRSSQYGTLTLGRQYDFMVDYVAPMSATGSGFGGNLADHPYDNDNLNNDMRLNNSIKFSSVSFDGFKAGTMFAFSNDAGQFSNNSAYSMGASYSYGAFNAAAAYVQVNRTANPASANAVGAVSTGDGDALTTGGNQQIFGAGVQYKFGQSSVGAIWTHSVTYNVTGIWQGGSTSIGALNGSYIKFDNFELNGRYFVHPNFSLGASYTYTTGAFGGTTAATSATPHWNQVMAQADYLFSPTTDVYLEGVYQRVSGGNGNPAFDASIYSLDPSSNNQQVVVSVGMRHRF
ncbi:porin [Pararobbsia alpina]|nr:porin [Pararobbsia alpina]